MTEVDPLSAPLTSADWAILGQVEPAILEGEELKLWWAQNRDTRVALNRFPVAIQIHRPDTNYAFLLNANLRTGMLPVAGVIQDQLYDYPKAPKPMTQDPQWVRSQVKAFVLNYFMRLTSAVAPPSTVHGATGSSLTAQRYGWGYEQWYYKLRGSGLIGKFHDSRRYDIIALPEVGSRYDWVVFLVNIYHFDFVVNLAGTSGPKLVISMPQPVYTVMTPDYVINRENPEPGVLGEYGYGYSVVPNPNEKTIFAAGPSQITNTIETLHFRVLETGEVRAQMQFITPQPPKIINFNPVEWSFDLADRFTFGLASKLLGPLESELEGFAPNFDPIYAGIRLIDLMTLGVAADEYCISKNQMFKMLMALHFNDAFNMFNLSASHFMMVPDWTNPAKIPEWAKHGTYGPGSAQWQSTPGKTAATA
jgi:hypothetical protein